MNGILQDSNSTNQALISKSLFRVIKYDYYMEQTKGPDGIKWKAWCAIPYSESLRQNFLNELIQLTQQGIEPVENQLMAVQTNPSAYLDDLESIREYYQKAQSAAQNWFNTPNTYTTWLDAKLTKYSQLVGAFYRDLVITIAPLGVNEMILKTSYQQMPYSGMITALEKSAVPMARDIVITRQNDGSQITIIPQRTGVSTWRIYLDKDRFPGVECFRDVTIGVQLEHIFTGKTIGLCCRDKMGARLETATALGKLITEFEGKSLDLSSFMTEDALLQAARQGCSYLMVAEANLTEIRENAQQNLFIAFPTLSLRVVDIISGQIVFQSGYPNPALSDIRGLGKTKEAATTDAYSLGRILSDQGFLQSFYGLKK